MGQRRGAKGTTDDLLLRSQFHRWTRKRPAFRAVTGGSLALFVNELFGPIGERFDGLWADFFKSRFVADEPQLEAVSRAVSVLNLHQFAFVRVIVFAMKQPNHVGILLQASRITQIAKSRTLAVCFAIQLREREDGNLQFLGQVLQTATDSADLFVSRNSRIVGGHESDVVNDD